jgi:hypothetical protein
MKDPPVNFPLPGPTPPAELVVVGEHRFDPLCLLLFGVDGQYYCYSLVDENIKPVEPDDEWRIEQQPTREFLQAS